MNIYKKLIECIKLSESIHDYKYNDMHIESAIRLAQANPDMDKDATIAYLKTELDKYTKAYNELSLNYQSLAGQAMAMQNNQGYGANAPLIKPSANIAGGTDMFISSNDLVRQVVQDGSNLQARVEHNENIPVLINTK